MKMTKQVGFTLVELMITCVIIGVLSMISFAVYSSYILQARRGEALQTILAISMAEERYRTSNTTYGTLAQVWNSVATTSSGYYTLAITNATATGYIITAVGVGNQANDEENGVSCTTLMYIVSSGTVTKTPSACWTE